MEKARQARELRKIINKEVPVSLDRTSNRLPDEFLEYVSLVWLIVEGGGAANGFIDEGKLCFMGTMMGSGPLMRTTSLAMLSIVWVPSIVLPMLVLPSLYGPRGC